MTEITNFFNVLVNEPEIVNDCNLYERDLLFSLSVTPIFTEAEIKCEIIIPLDFFKTVKKHLWERCRGKNKEYFKFGDFEVKIVQTTGLKMNLLIDGTQDCQGL